jgi:hypothetical protein
VIAYDEYTGCDSYALMGLVLAPCLVDRLLRKPGDHPVKASPISAWILV